MAELVTHHFHMKLSLPFTTTKRSPTMRHYAFFTKN
jgi:hypothetical protein